MVSHKDKSIAIDRDPRKKASPRASLISRLFFSWLDPLIWLGCKQELTQDDLYPAPEEVQSEYLVKRFSKYWNYEIRSSEKKGFKPRLWMVLFRCFKWILLLHGILYCLSLIPPIGQALLVGYLSQYFCEKHSLEEELEILKTSNYSELVDQIQEEIRLTTRDAYLYAAGITLISCLGVFIFTWTFYLANKIGMMHRVTMIAAIYSKVLRLSPSTIRQLSIGHVINLSSNDVQRFDTAFQLIHELWVVPLFLPIITYLLWREVGPSSLAALAIVLLQPPLQYMSTCLYTRWRLKSAKATDKRVRVMNEIISGMRLIKMYAWEWAFHEHVKKIRKKESRIITQASLIHGCNAAFFHSSLVLMSFVTFSTYAGTGNSLTPKKVFTSIVLLSFAKRFFVQSLVFCFMRLSELSVSVKRIEKLLLLPELGDKLTIENDDSNIAKDPPHSRNVMSECDEESAINCGLGSASDGSPPRIIVSNLTASWTHEREKLVLNNVSFSMDKSNRLLAVVGSVGSGKSSILQCLLGELETLDGSVDIEGSVSYVSQEPWVFSGTIKDNILFGKEYDEVWYKRVVECCSLLKDIADMQFGDETLVGERGVNLSGGQKARVNLARAVYRDSDIMLLDDPLSAVDVAVSKHLFEKCICGVLADKLVVLVTHQLQYAQHADSILVLKEGCTQGYGSYQQLTTSGLDPTELFDDNLRAKDLIDDDVFGECEDSDGVEPSAQPYELKQNQKSRRISRIFSADFSLVQQYRKRSSRSWQLSADFKVTEKSRNSRNQSIDFTEERLRRSSNMLRARSIDCTAEKLRRTSNVSRRISLVSGYNPSLDQVKEMHDEFNSVPEEERAHGKFSTKTYFTYIREGGNTLLAILLVLVFLVSEGSIFTANWWLSKWASEGGSCFPQFGNVSLNDTSDFDLTMHQRIGIYGVIVTSALLITMIKGIFAYVTCLNASRNLHNKMFRAILRTPILFFDTSPLGCVLNRFSADIGQMDSTLPKMFFHFFNQLLMVISIVIVACVANCWLIIPSVIVTILLLLLRTYFLCTARDLQRLEAIARSPLYSHISATIQGLTAIRAYSAQRIFARMFHVFQSEHGKGWYLKLTASRWFGLRLDIMAAVFISFVMFTSVPLADSLDPVLVGLLMAYTVNLIGVLQLTVRTSAEVENLLVSVERVMGYGKLEPEAELMTVPTDNTPPLEWPANGVIEFHNVNFRYDTHYPYVLKSLSLKIESGEKVGIVGRTGAGKSSLLAALFRLAEPEGVIEIDGVEINEIGLHDLRKKMSIIPQDPVLFGGTIRNNLDPFKERDDDQLRDALNEVQLKDLVLGLDGGLDAEVSEGGSNFSVGQRQLICLARALLRRNKILVIDEATANVDPITDGIIQGMIHTKFSHCTILTIAHRLETIMDSDRILVLSFGRVIEYDTPYNLLQTGNSVFCSMVERTGPLEAARLKRIAEQGKTLQSS